MTNGLTDRQTERLVILAEECAEVIHAVGKILRYGYDDWHPEDETKRANRDWLESELGDVLASLDVLIYTGDVRGVKVEDKRVEKRSLLISGR